MKPKSSVFKTTAGEARYLEAYETALELWPVPFEERAVPTEFGFTHVIISGPEDGQPLLLLPGMVMTLTSNRIKHTPCSLNKGWIQRIR